MDPRYNSSKCNKLSCKLWLSTIIIRTSTYCVRKPLLQLVSARQCLKRLVIATTNPLPRTKIWHRPTVFRRTINDTVALSNLQEAEDPSGGWAVGSLCQVSWWPSEWCCWFLLGCLRQSASPSTSHREPPLQSPHTKWSAPIFVYGIPLYASGWTVCSPKPLPLLLCCERHQGTVLSKKYGFYVPYPESMHFLPLTCVCHLCSVPSHRH